MSHGLLPGIGADVAVRFALFWPAIRVEAAFNYSPRRRVRFSDRPDVGADLSALHGELGVCARPHLRTVTFPLCVGLEVGAVGGRGRGAAEVTTRFRPYGAAVLAPGVTWAVHANAALVLRVAGVIPFNRPSFEIGGVGSVHVVNRVAIRALVGAEFRWGH